MQVRVTLRCIFSCCPLPLSESQHLKSPASRSPHAVPLWELSSYLSFPPRHLNIICTCVTQHYHNWIKMGQSELAASLCAEATAALTWTCHRGVCVCVSETFTNTAADHVSSTGLNFLSYFLKIVFTPSIFFWFPSSFCPMHVWDTVVNAFK